MVGATMSQLPPHYRKALEAKYVNGASVQQIAADCGLSEKAVESQLMRAVKAFRERSSHGAKPERGVIAVKS